MSGETRPAHNPIIFNCGDKVPAITEGKDNQKCLHTKGLVQCTRKNGAIDTRDFQFIREYIAVELQVKLGAVCLHALGTGMT